MGVTSDFYSVPGSSKASATRAPSPTSPRPRPIISPSSRENVNPTHPHPSDNFFLINHHSYTLNMRFFTRSPDLEAQAPNRVRNRSRTRSQSIAQPASPQQPRSHSHTRSMSITPLTAVSPARSAPLSKASTTKTLETPNSPTPVFSKPTIPYDNPLLATGGFTTAPTTPLADTRLATFEEREKLPEEVEEVDEKFEEEKRALLEKYDPGEPDIPVTQLSDVNMHRKMMRMFFVDNLLWANARLQRHIWIAASGKDMYKECMYFRMPREQC